jgi:hypothetical protein
MITTQTIKCTYYLAWNLANEVSHLGPLEGILRDEFAACVEGLSQIPTDQVTLG